MRDKLVVGHGSWRALSHAERSQTVEKGLAFVDGIAAAERRRVLDEVERRLPEPRGAFDWGLGYHVALDDVRRVLRAMRDGGGE